MKKWAYLPLTAIILSVFAPAAAVASARGRQNTAIALTATTVGAWARSGGSEGRRNTALVLTGATAYAWYRQQQAARQETRESAYRQGYRDARYASSYGRSSDHSSYYRNGSGKGYYTSHAKGKAKGHYKKNNGHGRR